MHMSQSQSMTMQQSQTVNTFNQPNSQTQQTNNSAGVVNTPSAVNNSTLSANNTDFSLEFFEDVPVGDTSNYTQELLNQLSENFIQDILQ